MSFRGLNRLCALASPFNGSIRISAIRKCPNFCAMARSNLGQYRSMSTEVLEEPFKRSRRFPQKPLDYPIKRFFAFLWFGLMRVMLVLLVIEVSEFTITGH